ncbi:hypothetical protein QBC33DRAFT_131799 [Phialemonium atrogriseum]|uniref:Uncharacterized protein n=1 Tax=Phialemonium atrogriseum TaxID=1093897 RepID=A0AAJ0FEL5_9PEZI|nr:uncharacterized protein QBC33DRAFT_131799 [Phialemonium atrogriseum]KAK1765701.1 hypothetical protein QBC33DRAFT_131799 [Phialemonium atrogriseum]
MVLVGNPPVPPTLDRSASSDLLPSLSDLGILETREAARQRATSTRGQPQLNITVRGGVSLRRSNGEKGVGSDCSSSIFTNPAFNFCPPLSSPKDCERTCLPSSPKTTFRLPSFSELAAGIAPAEPEWSRDQRSLQRRSSCESTCSAPSLTGTLSSISSPVSSPRSPLDGQFAFHMPQQQLPVPLPQYGAKFQLSSASEYLLAQANGFDTRNRRHSALAGKTSPPWQSSQATPFRHPRYSPQLARAPSPQHHHHHQQQQQQQAYRSRHHSLSEEALRRSGDRGAVCKRSPKTPHINKEYTLEQNLWIIYNHVDLKKPWKEVEDEFGCYFGIKVKRTDGGLQSTYYRWNEECPVIDEDGLLEYGEGDSFNKWDVKTHKAKVRGHGKISLIDRYASEVVEAGFSWILPQDMVKARQLAERRRPYREAYERRKKARLTQLMDCS